MGAQKQKTGQADIAAALDSLRTAITIFDGDGRLVYANAHLGYMLHGLPPLEALKGQTYRELIGHEIAAGLIAPAALAEGPEHFIARRLAQLQPRAYAPLDIALADRRILEIKARRTAQGQTVLLWSDVTQARAQMARLQETVRLSAEAFAFFDAQDRLVMGNALYAQLCGVGGLDELMGLTFPEIAAMVAYSGRIILDETPEKWLERRLKGHRQPAGAITVRTSNGECFLVRDRASADGGRVVVFTDATEKMRIETALKEQTSALAQAKARAEKQSSYLADLTRRLDQASAKVDSAKTTLLRTMGHELKTPLNAILGFSDLMITLADMLSPDQIREYAGLVHQGGNNLLKMINQIMDLTKISAGRYDLRRATVDAGALLWLAREEFAAQAAARGVTIDAGAAPVGLMVEGDEAVLTTMLQSLLDNAVTFTREGGLITLSAGLRADGVAVSIADDGAGVPPEDLARILEPFEHGGRAEGVQHAKGAGLGLTLVKAFAELHGGRLELSSAPGKGFTATLILPAARASAAA